MKFLDKLRDQLKKDKAATANSQAHLDEAMRTDVEVERGHSLALAQQKEVDDLARRLEMTNMRNGYSESLTLAFTMKERPAQ